MNTLLRWSTLLLFAVAAPVSAQKLSPQRTYPRFAIGPTGILATIEQGRDVTVAGVAPNSPAVGLVEKGDVLTSAGGQSLAVADPRVPLGDAIHQAEARGGQLAIELRRGTANRRVTLKLPALGAYSKTWPRDCPKSNAIVQANAAYIAGSQQADGSYRFDGRPAGDGLEGCLAGLFLLSTGDDKYLPNVRKQARALAASVVRRPTNSTWHLGYQGILLAEYYLRTGDREVLPGLKSLCDRAIETQAVGAWGHGGVPNPGYTQSGLINSAGVPVLTTLVLARECGVEVDEQGFLESLEFFYRMAGHGCICYGDHRSELWWSNTNGRNAMMACTLALLDEPHFQQAARHLALLVADSYYQPEFGHTGGGFNVIWRGMGSIHVPENRISHYRRQFDQLAWYYELCRQPGGGFSILPTPPDNARYSGLAWGTGAVGLTYTAPRRTLRITGSPRTKHSVATRPIGRPWGSQADLAFLETDNAEGFGKETTPPHEVYALLLGDKKGQASVEFCAKHLRHYSPLVRAWAARELGQRDTPDAIVALVEASQHSDPRVRRAAFDGISGYDNWGRPLRGRTAREVVSSKFLPAIEKTLADPKSAWWEIDGALFALGRAQPADIRRHVADIRKYAGHDEWYLREAAFWALDGLRESISEKEFEQLAQMYADETRVFARSSYDAGFRAVVKDSKVSLQGEALAVIAQTLGTSMHSPTTPAGYGEGGLHEAAHRTMMITKHFDPAIYRYMVDDLCKYVDVWNPYHQHSVWLMTGSKWQPGMLKVLDGLGEEGRPLCARLKKISQNFDEYDRRRLFRGSDGMQDQIAKSVAAWEAKYRRADEESKD